MMPIHSLLHAELGFPRVSHEAKDREGHQEIKGRSECPPGHDSSLPTEGPAPESQTSPPEFLHHVTLRPVPSWTLSSCAGPLSPDSSPALGARSSHGHSGATKAPGISLPEGPCRPAPKAAETEKQPLAARTRITCPRCLALGPKRSCI